MIEKACGKEGISSTITVDNKGNRVFKIEFVTTSRDEFDTAMLLLENVKGYNDDLK